MNARETFAPPVRVIVPRGLRREKAAEYIGVSPTKFDEWVADGTMPQPKRKGGVVLWDRESLDAAFDALPDREGGGSSQDGWADYRGGKGAAQAR